MRRLIASLLLLALVGCGFQLRRELVLPVELSPLFIEAIDPYSGLVQNLESALRRAGAEQASTAVDAARLRIPTAALTQRPLSISGSGQVQEFALQYRVEIELIDRAGTVRLPLQAVQLERIYRFDSAAALGSPGEEALVREELDRELAAAILRRVEAALQR